MKVKPSCAFTCVLIVRKLLMASVYIRICMVGSGNEIGNSAKECFGC